MAAKVQLGHVDSLFPHVKEDWWQSTFNDMYLKTNGDCVEDPTLTESECSDILSIPGVQAVLDLCCGQGRHSIHLAKQYPAVEFDGFDQSKYLLDLGRTRAGIASVKNIKFAEGDARNIPAPDAVFDLVLLMGNSFGYFNETDNIKLLKEVGRVLKPGGIFLIDHVDASWVRSNFSPSGWKWVNSHPDSASNGQPKNDNAVVQQKLLACRERELSPDKKRLASREIVIDLDGSVCQDRFYAVRLYDLPEMDDYLRDCGMSLRYQDAKRISIPRAEGTADLGMMESRKLIVAQKDLTLNPRLHSTN
ncbi:Demethylmenaquinone methyltransferase [Cladobotryum mycophilum]|uniref:Demethylmenaquinone methyltransferase n=1 Tax=Cladobotryum mycophilum TaxID=491253 RepID=A0ABR0SFB7_9HYPO